MLNGEIDTAQEKPANPIPIPTDGLGIEPRKNMNTLYVLGSNCLEYVPESEGDRPGIRTFGYEITLHFADEKSKNDFKQDPKVSENATTIRRTAEEMMQKTFQLENQRDAGGHYGPPGDPALVNTINENTYADIEIDQQDLGAIFQSTFPNAGITAITIDGLTVREGSCPAPYDPSFADNMTAPPPSSVASSGLKPQHYKR